MNRQGLILGAVVVALCLLVTWIARNTYWEEITVPTLPRGEAATNPFYAAQRLSEELGATSEWRRALGELPSTESVMFLTHWNWDLIDNRREALGTVGRSRWTFDLGRYSGRGRRLARNLERSSNRGAGS